MGNAQKLENNIYLGVKQVKCQVPEQMIEHKRALFHTVTQTKPDNRTLPNHRLKGYYMDLCGNIQECIDTYCKLAKCNPKSLVPVATPCIDENILPLEDFENHGVLRTDASKIVLKILWDVRITRPDIY